MNKTFIVAHTEGKLLRLTKLKILWKKYRAVLPIILMFISCTTVPDDIDVTLDTAKNGMIQGRVLYPTIVDNSFGYKGLKGATVKVLNTKFSVITSDDGVYAIDGIPTGSYTIKASWPDGTYETTTGSAVVSRQSTSAVPDIKMNLGYKRLVIYGKSYYSDKTTPFSNKEVTIFINASRVSTTTTSNDGSFGFDITSMASYYLAHYSNGDWYGFDFESYLGSSSFGIKKVDAYYWKSK